MFFIIDKIFDKLKYFFSIINFLQIREVLFFLLDYIFFILTK